MEVTTREVGYGMWEATARTEDGREATGGGFSEMEARMTVRAKLERVPCAGSRCGRWLSARDAKFSRRAYGVPVCARCQARMRGQGAG